MISIKLRKILSILICLLVIVIFVIVIQNYNKKKYKIQKSNINGVGVFATTNIDKDEKIDIAFKNIRISKNYIYADINKYFGSKINHCDNKYNTYLVQSGNDFYVHARHNIKKGDEITINYNNTPSTIKGPLKSFKKC